MAKLDKSMFSRSLEDLKNDPTILKFSSGRAQTRQMSMRKDYAWNIQTVDEALAALKRFQIHQHRNEN